MCATSTTGTPSSTNLLRNLHDERLSIWTHLIRMRVDQYPGGTFKSGFASSILTPLDFGRINRERMFINRFFVTLVIRPGATGSDKIIQLFKRRVSKRGAARTDDRRGACRTA